MPVLSAGRTPDQAVSEYLFGLEVIVAAPESRLG